MQRTVCFIAYTKKSTMLSLRVIIICSVRVVCKLQLCLLSSSLRNTVLLHTLFLEYETQIAKKNWTMFFNRIVSHAKLLTNLRKIEKQPKMRHKAVMHPALQLYSIVKLTL